MGSDLIHSTFVLFYFKGLSHFSQISDPNLITDPLGNIEL